MNRSTEYKTVQARILKYAQEIGRTYVLRDEDEARRGFDQDRVARRRSILATDCRRNPERY